MIPVLALAALHVMPWPISVRPGPCAEVPLPHTVARTVDAGAFDEVNERWSALGAPALQRADVPGIRMVRDSTLRSQAYRLTVDASGAAIASSGSDGAFYGMMTLAQLAQRTNGTWT